MWPECILGLFGSPWWGWYLFSRPQAGGQRSSFAHLLSHGWDKEVHECLGVGFRIYSLSLLGCIVPVLKSVTFGVLMLRQCHWDTGKVRLSKDWQGWETPFRREWCWMGFSGDEQGRKWPILKCSAPHSGGEVNITALLSQVTGVLIFINVKKSYRKILRIERIIDLRLSRTASVLSNNISPWFIPGSLIAHTSYK